MCCPKLHFSSSFRAAYLVSLFFLRVSPQKNRPNRPNQDLRETFKALDANGDGFLTVTELRDGIDKAGIGDGWTWMQWMEMGDHVETSQFGEFRIPNKIPRYKRGMVL